MSAVVEVREIGGGVAYAVYIVNGDREFHVFSERTNRRVGLEAVRAGVEAQAEELRRVLAP